MWFTAAALAIILSYTWYFEGRVPGGFTAVPIALVSALTLWHAARERTWGFDRRALRPASRLTLLVTLPGVLALLLAGALLGTLHDRRDFLGTFSGLLVWGGAQQWVLQTMVLEEARRVAPPRWAVAIAAALFAGIHLPNPFLTATTFVAGLAWCAIYARHPNILPLAVSHALGTLAILHAFDEATTGRLRIGAAYLRLD
ncbi:MAG TPA: CPBP family glutamic-type intramembrane protease [Vicinamibacterales bacterium]